MFDFVKRPLTLPKILDGKFYKDVQPNRKTVGGIQATCTACLGIISGTTKSTGNFLSHIKRRHKDILPSCQLYCQTKVPNFTALLTSAASCNDGSAENVKKEVIPIELHHNSLNATIFAGAVSAPHVHNIQEQFDTASPASAATAAFLWHKSLAGASTNSISVAAAMQYRKLKANVQANGCFINKNESM